MAGFLNAAYRVFDKRSQARANAEWETIRTGGASMNVSVPVRRRTRNQHKQQKLLQQRIAGGLVLLLSIVAVIITAGSPNFIDHDYTSLLFVVPLGIYLLLTKRVIFE